MDPRDCYTPEPEGGVKEVNVSLSEVAVFVDTSDLPAAEAVIPTTPVKQQCSTSNIRFSATYITFSERGHTPQYPGLAPHLVEGLGCSLKNDHHFDYYALWYDFPPEIKHPHSMMEFSPLPPRQDCW